MAAHTKINLGFFRDLERDDLSKWPANQFYRESYLRAYAEAVGLDPDDVIEAFRCEFDAAGTSGATESATKQRRLTPVTIPIIVAIAFVTAYSLVRWMSAVPADPAADGRAQLKLSTTKTESAAGPAAVDPATPPQNDVPTAEPAVPAPDAPAPVEVDQIEGELLITSTPSGARVLVNGIARGSTPVRVQFLPPGSHTVRFLLPGYSAATRNAAISPKRLRVPVSATLEPVPVRRAQVPAPSAAPADDVDGEDAEQNEASPAQLQ